MRAGFVAVIALLLCPGVLRAQAPDWAAMWRVPATTLERPAPLITGPAGTFWNPAAVADGRGLAFSVEVVQTPQAVGMSGVIAAATQQIGRHLGVGIVVGRIAVQDLVRTTTSPNSVGAGIPVYSQFAGATAGTSAGPVKVGVALRVHDARLDALRDGGITADVGLQVRPVGSLTLAAATHFASPTLSRSAPADYYAAAQYGIATTSVWGSRARINLRYGISYSQPLGLDHVLSAGLALDGRFWLDWGWTREQGYGSASWRSTLGVAFRTGRYTIGLARANPLSQVGATYRLALTVSALP